MNQKRLFAVSAGGYLLSSGSILLMDAGDPSGRNGSAPVAVLSAVIFWLALLIATIAQLLLRRQQKPHRQKLPFLSQALKPPTLFFEAGFLLALLGIIVLTILKVNGFVFFILFFLLLLSLELSILTMGKFGRQQGRMRFMTYQSK